jgi:RNA polymerase sigma factor (TIGR02999 family)
MGDITELLQRGAAGDEEATSQLVEQVYPQLRRIARNLLRSRHPLSLQVTEVVHEVYLKLVDQRRATWQNRAQFYAVAARLMRRILVDHARYRTRRKRGGEAVRVPLEEALSVASEAGVDVLALDHALDGLAEVDATAARLVELRYFGGLTVDEAALALGISRTTAIRGWQHARSWLYRALTAEAG